MGCMAYTEPQCLYKGAIYLTFTFLALNCMISLLITEDAAHSVVLSTAQSCFNNHCMSALHCWSPVHKSQAIHVIIVTYFHLISGQPVSLSYFNCNIKPSGCLWSIRPSVCPLTGKLYFSTMSLKHTHKRVSQDKRCHQKRL